MRSQVIPAHEVADLRISSHTALAEVKPRSLPRRLPSSCITHQWERASPGGVSARRTRWTRRSELVKVPSSSPQAVSGKITSA